jgi:L-fuconolactonase
MLIDAHQHFWRICENDCEWPSADLKPIYRDFLPGDLEKELKCSGIGGTVLVQSQPSVADTLWLIELAAQTPFVQAVVGWVEFPAADAAQHIERLAKKPKLRGLRPMLQNLDDDRWILQDAIEPALDAMMQLDLSFDALIYPRHLPVIAEVARRFPKLKIVVDHGAKPAIAAGEIDAWRAEMATVARFPNIYCKVSGLLTEAGPNWRAAQLASYVAHLHACFGAERLMWGSDWPVLNLSADYQQWWDLSRGLLPATDFDAIAGRTARHFYRID